MSEFAPLPGLEHADVVVNGRRLHVASVGAGPRTVTWVALGPQNRAAASRPASSKGLRKFTAASLR